jgi:serine/threonine protein kinase
MYEDIKPDNILLNLDETGTRVVETKLADCGKPKQLIALMTLEHLSHRICQVMHATSVLRPIFAVQLTP